MKDISDTPRAIPKQGRSQQRVEKIISTAHRLFIEFGVEETTTNDIAAAADMPIGSVYRYFRNKNEIIAALNERYVAALTAMIDEIRDNSLLAQLSWYDIADHLLTSWLQYIRLHRPYTTVYFQRSSPLLQSAYQTAEQAIFSSFARLVNRKRKLMDADYVQAEDEQIDLKITYLTLSGLVENISSLTDIDTAQRTRLLAAKRITEQLTRTGSL
jgi:AcrR family transcriptional regulator